jgi:hypothetical protein
MKKLNQNLQAVTPHLPLWSYQLQRDSKLSVRTRKELEINLLTRALKDEAFKQQLLKNPKAIIAQALGTSLPDGLDVNVLEETETTLYLVLPCNPYETLSENELQTYLGMTYEDVAQWLFDQQRHTFLDEKHSVAIAARAWRDDSFKQALLSNPKWMIEQEMGERIQDNLNIQVLAETVNQIFILIPRLPDHLKALESEVALLSGVNMPIAAVSGIPSNPPT